MYKCIRTKRRVRETEDMINDLEKDGWTFISSYGFGDFLIFHRE